LKTKFLLSALFIVSALLALSTAGCSSTPIQRTTAVTSNTFVATPPTSTSTPTPTSTSTTLIPPITTSAISTTKSLPTLSFIAITPSPSPNLKLGFTQQFDAIGTYSDGSTADITDDATWSSSDTSIATISSSGLATGMVPGDTNIIASLSGISSTPASLVVINPSVSSIAILPTYPPSLDVGYAQQFTATAIYADGSTADVTSHVIWANSNSAVATTSLTEITQAGVPSKQYWVYSALGLASGTTIIEASLDAVTSPPVRLTVSALSSIAVSPAPQDTLGVGAILQFNATGTYFDGSTKNITSEVTWVSSNTNVSVINSSGEALGIAPGSANIKASLAGISSSSVSLTVLPLTSIALTPNTPSILVVGATQQLTAIGTYSDGSTADISSRVIWSSDDTKTVSISSTGLATCVGGGTASITATLEGVTSAPVTLIVASS